MPDETTPVVETTAEGDQGVNEPVTEDPTPVETSDGAGETPLTPDPDEQKEIMRTLVDRAEKPDVDDGKVVDEVVPDDADKPVVEPPPLPESKEAQKPGEGEKPPELVEVSWTHKGIAYTEMMTPEKAESFNAKVTTAEKYAPLQTKYIEELERKANALETGEAAAAAGAEPETKQESIQDLMQLDQKQWVERWSPLVEEFKKTGYFGTDGEFAEAFPEVAADLALMRAVGLPLLNAVEQLSSGAQEDNERLYMQRFFNEMDIQLDQLSKRGEAFSPLADNEMRAKFFGHLQQLNVDGDKLFDSTFLAGQWRAFNEGLFAQVEADAAALAEKTRTEEIRRGTGARPGHAGAGPEPSAPDEQTALMRRLVKRLE